MVNSTEKMVPVRAGEIGLTRQFRPSRPALAWPFSIVWLNLVLTHGIPPDFRVIVGITIVPCNERTLTDFSEDAQVDINK